MLEPLVERVQLLAHLEEVAVRLHRALEDRPVELLRRLLGEIPEPRPLGHDPLSGLRRVLPQDDPDERRLPSAVRPDQGDAIPRGDGPRDVGEEGARADRVADVLEADQWALRVGVGARGADPGAPRRSKPKILRRSALPRVPHLVARYVPR